MLTFAKVLARSLLIAGIAIVSDGAVSIVVSLFGASFIEIMGDLMLAEVAILFLAAGFYDFSTSIVGAQFKKAVLGSKQGYSQSRHKEAERKALALVIAGVLILALLIAAAGLIRS